MDNNITYLPDSVGRASQDTYLIGGGDASRELPISLNIYLSRLDDLPMDGDHRPLQDDRQPWANLLIEAFLSYCRTSRHSMYSLFVLLVDLL